jgi:hypothetical protein
MDEIDQLAAQFASGEDFPMAEALESLEAEGDAQSGSHHALTSHRSGLDRVATDAGAR